MSIRGTKLWGLSVSKKLSKAKLRELAGRLGVVNFANYREFLAAVFAAAKAADDAYTYARYSLDLGLGSSNAHSIMHGLRPLRQRAGMTIAAALGLTGSNRRYFLAMIEQEGGRRAEEREAAFRTRLALRSQALPNELDRRQLAFFAEWHHAAVLEILRLPAAKDDAAWLARTMTPRISEQAATSSLELLQELGLIAMDSTRGRLYPTKAQVSTGDEVVGLAVQSYHRQMQALALQALDQIEAESRDISAVTISISKKDIPAIKDELSALRKRLMRLSEQSQDKDSVVQVNLQMFPLAQTGDE